MEMRADLTAVPHASLRNPNPERSRKALKSHPPAKIMQKNPCDYKGHTLMEMRTDLTAVPHASLKNPNPERSRKVLKSPEVFKRKRGQKLMAGSIRHGDGVPCVTADALDLYEILKFKQVHRADQALLPAQVDSFVGCSFHCALHPPAQTIQKESL